MKFDALKHLDFYLDSKLQSIKKGESEDEFGENPELFCIFDSPIGYFGLVEDDTLAEEGLTYEDIENYIPKIFKDFVASAEKNLKKVSKYDSNSESVVNGVKVIGESSPMGLQVLIPTDWVIKNKNKFVFDIPTGKSFSQIVSELRNK